MMWRFLHSLRGRLIALVLLGTVPGLGAILYTAETQRQRDAAVAEGEAMRTVQFVAGTQRELFAETQRLVQVLAQLPAVREGSAASCSAFLTHLFKQDPAPRYSSFFAVRPNGDVFCSSMPFKSRINAGDQAYYRRVMRSRAFAVGDYQIGRITGRAIVVLAQPVLDAAGEVRAIVAAGIDLAWLNRLAAEAKLPAGSTLTLVDHAGTVLARHPDGEKWIGRSMAAMPLLTAMHAQHEDVLETVGLDGVPRLYAFTAIYDPRQEGHVHVSVGIPTATVFAEADQTQHRHQLTFALAMLLMLGAAWAGGNVLVLRPANALMQAARRLGQGDLGARADMPHTADEFGQIARSFDDMASALQARQAEAARAEARFTNIVNLAADAIISVDDDQRILIYNQGAERIFGYTAAEVVGQSLNMLLPAHLAATHRAHVRRFAAEPDAARDMNRRAEIHGRRRDGTEFPAEASISKVKENGNFRFTVFLRDISARKKAEEEIRQLNVNLERRVLDRTAELAAANQELEAFSYSVSHDLRAPLRSIDGFSQAVLEDCADKLDAQARDHLDRVRAATQHMGQLIDDLIKLARVARAEIKREAVGLSALAADVLAALRKSEPDRRVECHIEPGLAAEGDARLLRVVLDNLLGNAWKFTGKQARARIEFGAHPKETGGPAYFVRDNGVGFDMTYAGKLFGAFQRLHTLSDFPGTGVGLATVQRIVHRHGGRVWAEGAVGKGATLYFTL